MKTSLLCMALGGSSALLLGLACAPGASSNSDEVQASGALPAVPAEVAVIPAEAEPPSQSPTEVGPKGTHYLLGVVGRDGTPVCDEYEAKWTNLHFDAGLTHLDGDEALLQRLVKQPVVFRGTPSDEGATRIAAGSHPCAPAQMRSDWVVRPDGYVSNRGMRETATRFAVSSAKALTPGELSARVDGDKLVLSFSNPLPIELQGLEIVIHYEGCYGKPGSDQAASQAETVAPGASTSFAAPSITGSKPGRHGRSRQHVARSVGLRATTPGVDFDFELPLSSLGVSLDCPQR